MPYQNKTPCNYPRCSELIGPGKSYCPAHKKETARQKNKQRKRDPNIARFYSSGAWQKTRKIYITNNPLCRRCLNKDIVRKSDVVDHIIPIKIDWNKRLDQDNLQSLCNSCHASKSEEDRQKYEKL